MRKGVRSGLLGWFLLSVPASSGCIPGYVRVQLLTTAEMNGGAPLYLVVRNIEFKLSGPSYVEPAGLMDLIVRNTQTRQTAGQSYGEIVALLDAPDGSVVRTQLLYPGNLYSFYLKAPNKGSLGMYFLFKEPGGTWNLLLDQPLPWRLQATLHGSSVSRQLAK